MYDGPKSWTSKFQRLAFTRNDLPNSVLVQYKGNETEAGQFVHGNSADSSSRPYIRTQPHVLRNIKTSNGSAKKIYRDLVTGAEPSAPPSALPRNSQQVRNIQSAVRNRLRPSRDALYNLHEFAQDSSFVQCITTHPDLLVILYHPEVVDIFNRTLSDRSNATVQQLSYDTTFCLGDYYLSVLLFRETQFEQCPVLPLSYLLHERKLMTTHDAFFKHMKAVLPHLDCAKNVLIVTDQEKAITEAVSINFPNLPRFLCWNHILQDCKRWLRSHGVTKSEEMTFYLNSVRTLLESPSLDDYKTLFIEFSAKFSHPFCEYFVATINPVIKHLSAWELHCFGLHQSTTNQSESFNCVLKRLQNWREAPIDSIVLSLFRLSQFHIAEVKRGRRGEGDLKLRSGLRHSESSSEIDTSTNIVPPEEIIKRIQSASYISETHSVFANGVHINQVCEGSITTGPSLATTQGSSSTRVTSSTFNGVNEGISPTAAYSSLSVTERATAVVASGQISLDPKLGIFVVNGTSEPRIVRLFPSALCSCPAKSNCYHITAARMSVGAHQQVQRKPLNLTQLRRNKGKKGSRLSGRKRPRTGDVDVVPAEDTPVSPDVQVSDSINHAMHQSNDMEEDNVRGIRNVGSMSSHVTYNFAGTDREVYGPLHHFIPDRLRKRIPAEFLNACLVNSYADQLVVEENNPDVFQTIYINPYVDKAYDVMGLSQLGLDLFHAVNPNIFNCMIDQDILNNLLPY